MASAVELILLTINLM